MSIFTANAFKHIDSDIAVRLTDEQLKHLQQELLTILDDLVYVCEKYRIFYTLGGGSCLGAVRHHGFIPWDDDIDFNITRKDYPRFVRAFKKEFGDRYWVHTPEKTDNYALMFARVRKKGTVVRTRDDFYNQQCGIFVDVFIIENTFNNKVLRYIHGLGCMFLGLTLSCRKFYRDRDWLLKLAGDDQQLCRMIRIKSFLGRLLSWGSINFWTRTANRWASICRDHRSEYVTIPAGRNRFFGELYCRKDVCTAIDMKYEGKLRKVPTGYDTYLTALYGDYMQIPKEEDRELHSFIGKVQF